MKKVLAVLVVCLMAASANAATIGLQWTNGDGSNYIEAYPTDHVWIDVVVTLGAGDVFSGAAFASMPVPELIMDSSEAVPPFVDGSTYGPLGFDYPSFNHPTSIAGPWSGVIGRYDIHVSGAESDTYEIMINHATLSVLDGQGNPMTYGPDFAGVVANWFKYADYGCPGADGSPFGSQDPNPLILHVLPEPGSLALLALGGLALLRRR